MKKQLVVLSAAAIVAAAAVPALAFENEFHGMYKMMGYYGNFFEGATMSPANANTALNDNAKSGWFAEQRARLMYIAKANDDLKLVTHFELDTRFGGKDISRTPYLGAGNDAGNLDADQLTLETKSIYLDFNSPVIGTNMKVGLQPWADAYQSLFVLADMTGVNATKKFDAFTGSLGWYRFDDNTTVDNQHPGKLTADLITVDGKFAINKDMKVGASYYFVNNDTQTKAAVPSSVNTTDPGSTTDPVTAGSDAIARATRYDNLHMVGLNADLTFGPANIKPFAGYQFGEFTENIDFDGYLLGLVAKVKAGPGAFNFSTMYLSGDDKITDTKDRKDFQVIGANQTYFNAANMWLLVRNGQAVNSSTSILGNDMTVGGRGLWGIFGGYEGKYSDRVFYNANVGYAQTAEERNAEDGVIGTEINAQVGYKLFDNMSVSAAAAYAFLGNGMNDDTAAKRVAGSADANDPYMMNVQVSYTF